MISGIVGVLLVCCYVGLLFGVGGIVLGTLGKKKENAKGMAMTGIITGYVAAILGLIFIILTFAAPALLSGIPGVTSYSSFSY